MEADVSVVLRVSGLLSDPDEILAHHELAAARVWRAGERNRRGELFSESGFNLPVADCRSEALDEEIRNFLGSSRDLLIYLGATGARLELDVGLMVFAKCPNSVALSPGLLGSLSRRRIGLAVTGYPCCESETD